MKITFIGIILICIAVGLAGNWLYVPFSATSIGDYDPIPHYPADDPADDVYSSDLIYIPSKNMSYIEFSYTWLNISGHTPDTERVRIYVKNGEIDHVSLSVHYNWFDMYEYTSDGNHVHIYFTPVYHTPYVSESSLITSYIQRALPFLAFLIIGITLISFDITRNRDKKKHPQKIKINTKLVDGWTPVHFIIAFFMAMLLTIMFRNMAITIFLSTFIIVGWEISEKYIKKYYDIFNIPFGRKTVMESPENSMVDIIAGLLGLLFFVFVMMF
jgi:hypothetical protein